MGKDVAEIDVINENKGMGAAGGEDSPKSTNTVKPAGAKSPSPRGKKVAEKRVDDMVRFKPGQLGQVKIAAQLQLGSDFGVNALDTYLDVFETIIPDLYAFVEKDLYYSKKHLLASELGKMIDERMSSVFSEADVALKIESLEKTIKEAGIDLGGITNARPYSANFSSPHARKFILGIQQQDRLVTLYQLAWVTGLVGTELQRSEFYKSTRVVEVAFNRINQMMKTVERKKNPLVSSGRRDGRSFEEANEYFARLKKDLASDDAASDDNQSAEDALNDDIAEAETTAAV